jgi:hypothetical protein
VWSKLAVSQPNSSVSASQIQRQAKEKLNFYHLISLSPFHLTLSHIYAVIQIKLINPMNIKKKKKNK